MRVHQKYGSVEGQANGEDLWSVFKGTGCLQLPTGFRGNCGCSVFITYMQTLPSTIDPMNT